MSSNALEAQGTLISIGNGASPEVFAAIGEIKNFSGPGGQASVIDVSDLDSTGREKRMGLPDEGQLTLSVNFIPGDTQHALLRTKRAARTIGNFKITFTDSPTTYWTFAAFVTGLSITGGVDGVVEGSITLEISGAITET